MPRVCRRLRLGIRWALLTGAVPEKPSSNPLKRFGTVLGRRRQNAHPYGRASSPERKSSSNLGSTFSGFGKGRSKDRDALGVSSEQDLRPNSPLRRSSQAPRSADRQESPTHSRLPSSDAPNGTILESPMETEESSTTNGTALVQDSIPELREPLSPSAKSEPPPEVW